MAYNNRVITYDDQYATPLDWYLSRMPQEARLKFQSPSGDGTNTQLVKLDAMQEILQKDLQTSTGGAANAVYDMGVFIQYATMANTFGALPKRTWPRIGFRAASTASSTSGLGIAEGAAVPASVDTTYVEIAPTIKEFALVHDYTQRLVAYEQIADAVSLAQDRRTAEIDFFKSLNADMHVDFDTLASNNIESVDRVTASDSEETSLSYTAGDADLHGVDRSANSWFDANADHNSGTDRNITEARINQLREDQEPYWESPVPEGKLFITGYDTWDSWSELVSGSQRFTTETVTFSVNGIQTSPGGEAGFKIATWDQIPVVRDDNVQTDTISRVYLLDTDGVSIFWALPPSYVEADPMGTDRFSVGHIVRGERYGMGELVTTKAISQGKLRDLQ